MVSYRFYSYETKGNLIKINYSMTCGEDRRNITLSLDKDKVFVNRELNGSISYLIRKKEDLNLLMDRILQCSGYKLPLSDSAFYNLSLVEFKGVKIDNILIMN